MLAEKTEELKEEKEAAKAGETSSAGEQEAKPKRSPRKKKKSGPVYYLGTGRRKNAVARVRLTPGTGRFRINKGRDLQEYFGRSSLCLQVQRPLATADLLSKYDVIATIHGGGLSGQAGALSHGIARALLSADDSLRGDLKKAGLLTRDSRMTERKKYGLKKARKRPQFSKR